MRSSRGWNNTGAQTLNTNGNTTGADNADYLMADGCTTCCGRAAHAHACDLVCRGARPLALSRVIRHDIMSSALPVAGTAACSRLLSKGSGAKAKLTYTDEGSY
jgi:hypothetical protein